MDFRKKVFLLFKRLNLFILDSNDKNILFFYIFKEIFFSYIVSFLFLTLVVYIEQIFGAVIQIVEYNLPFYPVLVTLPLYLPLIAEYTIPIAVILGTIIAISRLSDDNEIIAMRACGLNFKQILIPVITFGVCILFLMLLFYEFFFGLAKKKYMLARIRIVQINPVGELVKTLSFKSIDGSIISVESIKDKKLKKIWIKSPNSNRLIYSPYGYLLAKDETSNSYPLILFHTTIQTMFFDKKNSSNSNSENNFFHDQTTQGQIIYLKDHPIEYYKPSGYRYFSSSQLYKTMAYKRAYLAKNYINFIFDYYYNEMNYNNLDLTYKKIKNNKIKNKKSLLKQRIYRKNLFLTLMEKETNFYLGYESQIKYYESIMYYFYRQFAFSFAGIIFTILGLSLGIFNKRAGKGMSLAIGVSILSFYLIMTLLGEVLLEKNILSSFWAAWITNSLFFIFALYILSIRFNFSFYMKSFFR